jgi:hypothetical protein
MAEDGPVMVTTRQSRAALEPATLPALLAGPARRSFWLVALAALLAVLAYAGLNAWLGQDGYPLDDAWIHQTYARNLAQSGRWAFIPGQPSAGSTAPLWTLMLSPAYLLGLPPLLWTIFLGWLCLVWCAWLGMILWRTLWPAMAARSVWAGLAIAVSWSLVWAAGSGMETLLFSALALQQLLLYSRGAISGRWRPWLLGAVAGLMILARPEGLILLLLCGLGLLLAPGQAGRRAARAGSYLVAAALALAPYFALNLAFSGRMWPNTFYAKQAEYAFLWRESLPARFLQLAYFALGGPAEGARGMSGPRLLLLPGLMVAAWRSLVADGRARRLLYSLPLIWAAGHVFVYAWRLPVLYQHGRYLLPVLPVIIVYGLAGWFWLAGIIAGRLRSGRWASYPHLAYVAGRATGLVFAVLVAVFLLLGRQAYVADVGFINQEMVAVARWIDENTPPGAYIAAHDIGAIGYFSRRPLLDLAGLVSPDVAPLLGDEGALGDYVRDSGAEYLVTAPGWPYTAITAGGGATLLFETGNDWTRQQGSNNMAVYALSQ